MKGDGEISSTKLKGSAEEEAHAARPDVVFFASNLGNASSHATTNFRCCSPAAVQARAAPGVRPGQAAAPVQPVRHDAPAARASRWTSSAPAPDADRASRPPSPGHESTWLIYGLRLREGSPGRIAHARFGSWSAASSGGRAWASFDRPSAYRPPPRDPAVRPIAQPPSPGRRAWTASEATTAADTASSRFRRRDDPAARPGRRSAPGEAPNGRSGRATSDAPAKIQVRPRGTRSSSAEGRSGRRSPSSDASRLAPGATRGRRLWSTATASAAASGAGVPRGSTAPGSSGSDRAFSDPEERQFLLALDRRSCSAAADRAGLQAGGASEHLQGRRRAGLGAGASDGTACADAELGDFRLSPAMRARRAGSSEEGRVAATAIRIAMAATAAPTLERSDWSWRILFGSDDRTIAHEEVPGRGRPVRDEES
jgi:hypothetical protein